LAVRYDVLNNATEGLGAPGGVDPAGGGDPERKFSTLGIGAQYFFTKKTRAIFNYEFRDAEAPNQASDSNANKILSGMDNRLTFQILHIF
jgi:predicted porin